MPNHHPKASRGKQMEGWIARWYERTRRNDMDDFREQAKAVARRLRDGCDVLEVAPGPGFFLIELAQLGNFKLTGLDISRTFVDLATLNARNAKVMVDFRHGNVSAMDVADESFDFVYCSAAFKNFAEPLKALNEIHRVLRPGGEALIVDLRKDVSLEQIDSYIKQSGRRRIDAWLTRFTFRHMLIKRAYALTDFSRLAEQSDFHGCKIDLDAIGFNAHFARSAAVSDSVR